MGSQRVGHDVVTEQQQMVSGMNRRKGNQKPEKVYMMVNFEKEILFYIGVWFMYSVLLVSSLQPSDSLICIRVSILFIFFSHLDYY